MATEDVNFYTGRTVEILIMHGTGSHTSLCSMRYYALSDLTLSVKDYFVPMHFFLRILTVKW